MTTEDEIAGGKWRFEHDDGVIIDFAIVTATPAEARQLEQHQAQVIREVCQWLSQQPSVRGEDPNG
ncbi:hypothetical protein AB0B28_06710 [Glycomyces sp. NPDC046736]|uniref:hypothetical protein n=1 Tax=Glycomyces sp. NPDC046736 TaxID=3155615 RepID=UPI00340FAA51